MGLSYTGETTMNEAAFRDVEGSSDRNVGPWRDKIEVRLDNRQVFFLFFGSALCACMLFVLGVIVGKRLESRGRAAIPEVQDPLAVLDRVNSPSGSGAGAANARPEPAALTFPKALIGSSVKVRSAPTMAIHPAAPALPVASPAAVPKALPPPKAVPLPRAPASAPKLPSIAATPKSVAVASVRLAALPAPKPAALWAAPAVVPTAPAIPAALAAKGKFTLVLSSFPERGEADAFAKRFAAQGAYVAVAETTPGKGSLYRVRVGNYASAQEASAAKTAFEKQTSVIAYIAGR